jgi:anti-sigma-K factor RskA
MSEVRTRELEAFHDGELGLLGRLRVRLRLLRDPVARRELRWLADVRALLREELREATAPPDLWSEIRSGLPPLARGPDAGAQRARSLPAWRWALPAAAVAAAAGFALTFGIEWGHPPDARSLRWLDAEGKPALVLQDDGEATIIWVLHPSGDVSRRARGAMG